MLTCRWALSVWIASALQVHMIDVARSALGIVVLEPGALLALDYREIHTTASLDLRRRQRHSREQTCSSVLRRAALLRVR